MCSGLVKRGLEVGAFGLDRGGSQIADLADRLGRPHIADCLPGGKLLLHLAQEDRIAQGVSAGPALPRSAKTAHAVLDVKKEPLALLFAVIADVDPGISLLVDDGP